MAWFKLEDSFPRHFKIKAFARALNLKPVTARGHLVTLWCWVLDFAPDGDLQRYSEEIIAQESEWDGSPTDFVSALVTTGLLDRQDDGSLTVHGWWERAGNYKKAQNERARVQAKSKPNPDRNQSGSRLEQTETRSGQSGVLDREERRGDREEIDPPQSPPRGGTPGNLAKRDKHAQAISEVYAHWRKHHPRAPDSLKSDSLEYRRIKARLAEGATVETLKAAVDGCHRTPHNLGANDTGRKHLGLDLICRSASHVTRFAETAEGPPPRASPLAGQRLLASAPKEIPEPDWVEEMRRRDAERARKEQSDGRNS